MFTDTHCHLPMLINKDESQALTEHDLQAIQTILHEATSHNVTNYITISTTRESIDQSLTLAKHFPHVTAAVGLHPCDYGTHWKTSMHEIRSILQNTEHTNNIVAIGECGLDFHHPGYDTDEQTAVFQAQIELALEFNLPIVVHSRKATEAALRAIEPYKKDGIRGVIHCYGGDASLAQDIVDNFGFYVGIAGPITYPKNDSLREAVKSIGINNILLETDAPFLPPQVIRGKRNHPLYIETIAQQVADVLDLPIRDVGRYTNDNVKTLFNIAHLP